MKAFLLLTGLLLVSAVSAAEPPSRPNVVLIITDDQGFGDLGCHGNPDLKTPHLDAFAKQSVWLRQFLVSPVCAPTRAALMTGRDTYRTGVTDTYEGRAMMRPSEVTLAEMLGGSGYRTAIFGKWHLGDNAPLRAIDQGFQEALVLKGGGIGQPSDPPGGESYFNPLLLHNGTFEKTEGYCSDVYVSAALRYLDDHAKNHAAQPFFVYLAFNAPHTPLEVPEAETAPYPPGKLSPGPHPIAGKMDQATTSKIYGMVSNIDRNLGRLFDHLDQLKLADDTIVVFMTDNGPQQPRYCAGLRGLKGSVYEGGVRVPCYVRWPRKLAAGSVIDTMAAHLDLTPTLLEATGTKPPADVKLDGRSLLPLLEGKTVDWPERTLFLQWHRGNVPEQFRAFAARTQTWKLVQAQGVPPGPFDAASKPLELYDLASDPYESRNVAAEHPEIVQKLKAEYEAWFKDVGSAGYDPPRISLGSAKENPVILTRQDWRDSQPPPGEPGYWLVDVAEAGTYEVIATFLNGNSGEATLKISGKTATWKFATVAARENTATFGPLELPAGPTQLQVTLDAKVPGPRYVQVSRKSR